MDEEPQFEDDLVFDENYVEDTEQQTQEDLNLSEIQDDLDTDMRADLLEQEKDLKEALTSSAASILGRGKITGEVLEGEASNQNPYGFPVFRTRNYLTKYERTALLGMRAEQLRRGAPPYVDPEIKEIG